MTIPQGKDKADVVGRLLDLIKNRFPPSEASNLILFSEQYFARAEPEDLSTFTTEELLAALLGHWHLALQRKPGEPQIKVFNPTFETQGWASPHTVVQIVVDDMPFLVDSTRMALVRQGLFIHMTLHPVIRVRRDKEGKLREVLPRGQTGSDMSEAVMRFDVDRIAENEKLVELQQALQGALADVRCIVEDWQPMRTHLEEVISTLSQQSLPVAGQEKEEILAFLRWVAEHHFTFLGYRAYDLVSEHGQDVLRAIPNSGLGLYRETGSDYVSQSFSHIPAPLRSMVREPNVLVINKATAYAPVHRPTPMDYLGIKRFNDKGEVIGEWRFVGLYSSTAYSAPPEEIPILRAKVARIMARAGFDAQGHSAKALRHVLATFPRDEMFQATEQELYDIAMGILQVEERHRLRLFLRRDPFDRFISAFVYVPRDRYNTEFRMRMQDILMRAMNGQSAEYSVNFTETVLWRVHFMIRTQPGNIPEINPAQLESMLAEAMQSWSDTLQLALREHYGEGQGLGLMRKYGASFPIAYRSDFDPRIAVLDIEYLESITDSSPMATHLYRFPEGREDMLRFKVYGRDKPMALSDVLPILERMGLRVLEARPYEIEIAGNGRYWILDFDMTVGLGVDIDLLEVKEIFQAAFVRVCAGEIESDGFNRLVLCAGLGWRQVVMLRAVCKYLLQTSVPFSQAYMENALSEHPDIAEALAKLFLFRFDPQNPRAMAMATTEKLVAEIEKALDAVTNLDEDRILRRYLAVIQAMLRTNYFQNEGQVKPKTYLSFKLDPAKVPELPLPRPMFEIFVYAPFVEGVHLRGGPVARGGIRWSDRREDFRTEILGLMKAQMVKNTVIVPVGAKGGFFPKRLPASENRDAVMAEVVRCYRTFISGLLDITDNLVEGKVVPPADVVRYDSDDTYLVVAADKGTATFSDIANAVSAEYNFWMGDAFASGGSSGYDHKKMGITARGGWESVKRNFYELGIDCQNQDFTVVGIGDMAGDVFGNGLLRSRHIKLVAAFNHMHIFIDPNPDPERSFQERERMFNLPRSTWNDYDKGLISAGGGVYLRSAKSIQLSTETQKVLGIEVAQLTPVELIQAILRAPVDLLWNGGIGTYVKASSETHAAVGDRVNDSLRIDGGELRCKVVGEGGNLGFTQLGRVEYARKGGLINTDFIDNSGGVDCSDNEVNIKILLNQMVRDGDMTLKQRNELLLKMTSDVGDHVLKHNYLQSLALSLASHQASWLPAEHGRLIRALVSEGRLNRKLEFLPGDDELVEREKAGEGLTRPEIAILLAYSKIKLFEDLCASDIAEDPYFTRELIDYFPTAMHQGFTERMQRHPLRREIIATQVTNAIVNRMGSTFMLRMQDETGESAAAVARACTATWGIFNAEELWAAVAALDGKVPAKLQSSLLLEIRRLHDRATVWLLRNRRAPLDIATTINQFRSGVETLTAKLPAFIEGDNLSQFETLVTQYREAGISEDQTRHFAAVDAVYPCLDLIEIASEQGGDLSDIASTYFKLGYTLELFWLRDRIQDLPRGNYWQRKARMALRYDLYIELRTITKQIIQHGRQLPGAEARVAHWMEAANVAISHFRTLLAEIRSSGSANDLAVLSVVMREIRTLAHWGPGKEDC
ncbi:MAG: NAD-glutamate dehydrogenase [Gammaproteobacteria bacterium]|nr:NAD-glutamate dehydrogenase [Gammaproteobacteria bacterium]